MTKEQFDRWKRTRQLQRAGWDVEPIRTVAPHHGPETVQHFVVKALVAYAIEQRGRTWATEVEDDERGRVDVLDWGPSDGYPVVYEIESDCTPTREREKVSQDCGLLVQDVLVVSLGDAPGKVTQLRE